MRIVLDTNIWLDCLVFRDASVSHLQNAVAGGRAQLPKCRDPDDQKFLEAALAAGAQCLVTKDHALLELSKHTRPFRILTPKKFPAR